MCEPPRFGGVAVSYLARRCPGSGTMLLHPAQNTRFVIRTFRKNQDLARCGQVRIDQAHRPGLFTVPGNLLYVSNLEPNTNFRKSA